MVFANMQVEKRPVRKTEPAQRAGRDQRAGHVILPHSRWKPAGLERRCVRCGDPMEMTTARTAATKTGEAQVGTWYRPAVTILTPTAAPIAATSLLFASAAARAGGCARRPRAAATSHLPTHPLPPSPPASPARLHP